MFANINDCENGALQPGAEITAQISGYTHDGWGVARLNGRVVFIPGALQGEQVRAEIAEERRGVFYARLLAVLEPSAQRVQPDCPVYDGCGGCQLQHMSYAEELQFKQGQVQAALQRLGGFAPEELACMRPIIPAADGQIYHYRNKGIFHVIWRGDKYTLSFWDENSHQPARAVCQLLFPMPVNSLLERLQDGDLPPGVDDVLIRYSFAEQRLMLFLCFSAPVDDAKLTAARNYLQQISAEFAGLLVWGVRTTAGWQIFSSESFLTDSLDNVQYQIAPEAFFQINNSQILRLLAVLEKILAPATGVLLDAYCGIGTLGIYLAKHLPGLQRLIGVEVNAEAVHNARNNARQNGLRMAEFWQGRAENEFARLLKKHINIDAAVVDPPRRGCHKQLLNGLLQLAPEKLVYVSCNPATLARDLQMFCAEKYALSLVQPVDMFPRTKHVECVALMSRVNAH